MGIAGAVASLLVQSLSVDGAALEVAVAYSPATLKFCEVVEVNPTGSMPIGLSRGSADMVRPGEKVAARIGPAS
jgi:hypothetical protein